MRVLLPFKKDLNPYLNEIEQHFKGDFIYGSMNDIEQGFDIVNFHWPEAIFGWTEPTWNEIEELKKWILNAKRQSKLVYTRHNYHPHYRNTKKFKALYSVVENNIDAVIHLGKHSYDEFKITYPNIKHTIVRHPLYSLTKNSVSKEESRIKLNLPKTASIILVFGKIRSKSERNLIFKVFEELKIPDKLLLVTRMQFFVNKYIPYRFKKKIEKFLMDVWAKKKHCTLLYEHVNGDDIQYFFNAADVVWVPRLESLNSGIVFLANTFNKVVVAPSTGNISEHMEATNMPQYNPNVMSSVVNALDLGLEISKKGHGTIDSNIRKDLEPKIIANSLYEFFKSIM